MKIFLSKLALISLPVIIIMGSVEVMLRRIPNDYSYKNAYLKNNAQNIETLFMGSSHAYYGINPEYFYRNSFNASHISQTIDLDYRLIEKYSDSLVNLKNIIIPVDYFTLFSRTSEGIEAWRMKNYNIYYKLRASINPLRYFELFSLTFKENFQRLVSYYYDSKNAITCSSLGFGIDDRHQDDLIETGKTAAKRHTKVYKKHLKESLKIIDEMILLCKRKNTTLVFYTSPAYITYRNNLDSAQYYTTIKVMDSICSRQQDCYYFNFIDDKSFVKDDFTDADHLNKQGAKKLTELILKKTEGIIKKPTI